MADITASWRRWWKRERKLDDPAYLARHPLAGGASEPIAGQLPHKNLVVDPISDLSNALDQFHSWQVQIGFDLLRSGQEPQTAADAQNVMAAKEHQPGLVSSPAYQVLPPQPTVLDRLRHKEPWHDPMSTIPGGPGSMGPAR